MRCSKESKTVNGGIHVAMIVRVGEGKVGEKGVIIRDGSNGGAELGYWYG